ncbi:IclR family transcriptional regulator [Cohnella rhizosphaerae]|uniref:IclR family transcriptional regulator n=1 Tax=Cohnella rhizosphaerae TaxID=1457232 RepID=A0A9X4KQ87_9BACL|nr:IclR family transcriptional regulator [Cohnella rhizosphaerae]MDG0808523.1 IclR family transcriptional regulator [Cohnella rhizosphaerae]
MELQKNKVKSADRVLDIFELYEGETESYSLSEISKILNMPPSSTYNLLQNMLERGYLETDKTGKQYQLGYKLFSIRNKRMKSGNLSEAFINVADKIFNDLNETVHLAVRMENMLLYVGEKSSTHLLRFNSITGQTAHLHATASGKVLLAELAEEELRKIYPNDALEKVTEKTISSYSDLLKELAKVRKEKFGYNMGETVEGVHCVSRAIYDAEKRVVAAISISIPVVRITGEVWGKVHDCVKRASEEISIKAFG